MKKIIYILLLISVGLSAQTTYHVHPDSTLNTIAEVNALTLEPGDSVLFARGHTWRLVGDATLTITDDGERGDTFWDFSNFITIGAYGSGAKPRLLGSRAVSGWTASGTANVWQASHDYDPRGEYQSSEVLIETTGSSSNDTVVYGDYFTYGDLGDLSKQGDCMFNSGTMYMYSTVDPDTYTSVEVMENAVGVSTGTHEYITIRDLEIAYIMSRGIDEAMAEDVTRSGRLYDSLHIHHIGRRNGGLAYGHNAKCSDAVYRYNSYDNCGRRAIAYDTYGGDGDIVIDSIYIYNCTFRNGWHTTSLDAIADGTGTFTNVWFYNNFVGNWDSYDLDFNDPQESFIVTGTSNPTYVIRRSATATVENIFFYNNIFTYRPGGAISMGSGIDSLVIAYNTFYLRNITVPDNIVASALHSGGTAMQTDGETYSYNNIFIENYHAGSQSVLYEAAHADMSQLIEHDYNLYYETNSSGRIAWTSLSAEGAPEYDFDDFADWQTEMGYDANSSITDDVEFESSSPSQPSDLTPQSTSPAVGAATPISWITTDYFGNPRDESNPTIGAIEYQGASQEATRGKVPTLNGLPVSIGTTIYYIPE